MRPKFRETLETYGHIAKGEMADKSDPRLKDVKDWNVDFAADEHRTTKRTQHEIFGLQKRKQKVMADLKESLRSLDNPDYKPQPAQGERFIVKLDGQYFWQTPDGKLRELTYGDLMTDVDWGIQYFLDPVTVPRNDRKKYLIENAKNKLQELLDRQIVLAETDREGSPESLKQAYENWLAAQQSETENYGFITEKMVQNFLKKLAYDFNVDFQIEQADIFQDVNQKVDFIIRRKTHRRGVHIEAVKETLGVQFTTNLERVEHKQYQIEKAKKQQRDERFFEDIVLVSLPLKSVKTVYRQWKELGQPSGGPDKIWFEDTKQKIFKAVLKDIFTPEEIEDNWQRISSTARVDRKKAA